MEATGILAVGESSAALAYVKARRGVSPRQTKLILVICMLAIGVPAGAWASGSWLDAASSVEFAIIGLFVGTMVVQRIAAPSMGRALAKRGQTYKQQLIFRITPVGLVYDLEELSMTARWSCVTDLYQTRRYWVFLVQSSAMVLPRRFFATRDDERNFIALAMSRMPAAAQERSPDATGFLSS